MNKTIIMDNTTHLVRSSTYVWASALVRPAGVADVAGDPQLTAGLLLGYLVLGLGSYILAFWSQRTKLVDFYKSTKLWSLGHFSQFTGVQNIHKFLHLLILIDVINVFTAVMLVTELLGATCTSTGTCYKLFPAWFFVRYFGVLLHLLNALVCVFYLCHPQRAAKVCCFSTLLLFLVSVLMASCLIASVLQPHQEVIFGLGVIVFGLALAIIAKCAVSTAPPSTAIHRKPIVIVAMFTVLFVFTPNFVLYCLLFISSSSGEPNDTVLAAYGTVVFFTNFNLPLDALLCNFILRVPVEEVEEQLQQQTMVFENYIPTSG